MSDPYFHYTHIDDRSDGSSFSSDGTESKPGYHALERTSYLPVYQASHGTSAVSPELRRSVFPPTNWSADTSTQTQRSPTAVQFDPSPFLLPPTLRGSPIPSHASDNCPSHFGYNASSGAYHLISEHHLQTVSMPTLIGDAQCGDGLIDAHTCHYNPSSGFVHDNYMVEYPRVIPSPIIGMPIVPTYLGVGASSYVDPILPSDPTLRWSPRYSTTTYQHVPPPDSTLSPSPPGGFDSASYSPSSPLSSGNHSLVAAPSEMSNQNQPQSITTTSIDQLYTFTVPLQDVEFPSISVAGEVPFFQCCWGDCGIWITSDHEAVKDHLTRTHRVVLNGKMADSACCEWVGCSSSSKRGTLVRHFRIHLGLRWVCSVCKGEYTRTDSVKCHARKKPRCQLAQAISYPSAVAYRATGINGDNTVTLTKILQP